MAGLSEEGLGENESKEQEEASKEQKRINFYKDGGIGQTRRSVLPRKKKKIN